MFNKAKPLWINLFFQKNIYVWFKSNLYIDKIPQTIKFRIISTVPYQLFCNTKFCGWGPWRGTKKLLWISEHNLTDILKKGDNEILLLMHYCGVPSGLRDSIEPWWMSEILVNDRVVLTSNQEKWSCQKGLNWKQNLYSSWYLRGFCEYYKVKKTGSNPFYSLKQKWEKPVEYPLSILQNFSIEETKGVPPVSEICKPYKFKWANLKEIPYHSKQSTNKYQFKVEERWHSCDGYWLTDSLRKNITISPVEYFPPDGNKIKLKGAFQLYNECFRQVLNKKKTIAVLFDFGKEVSGFWNLEISSGAKGIVHILHSEQLNKDGFLLHRLENSNTLEIIPGKIQWMNFQQNACKYILLVLANVEKFVEIKFNVISTIYPDKKINIRKINDPFLKKSLNVASKTLRLCLSDGFMDCPERERAEWIGDGLLDGEVVADIFSDPEPLRRLLWNIISANVCGEILPAVIPSAFLDKIPLYDFQSVISICNFTEKYLHKVPNKTLFFIKNRIHTYYNWLSAICLLENIPGRNFQGSAAEKPLLPVTDSIINKWIKGEDVPTGKGCYDFHTPRTRGINATTNAIWLYMLERVIKLLRKVDNKFASECEFIYNKGKNSFIDFLWDEKRGFVKERIPDLPDSFVPSELPQYATLSAGLLGKEQAKRVISYCFNKDNKMIRILSPYSAKFVIEGLLRYNEKALAYRYLKCVFGPMVKEGDTLWESFLPVGGSKCHAWGAYSLWYYYKKIR